MHDVTESMHGKTAKIGLSEAPQFSMMSIREAQRVVSLITTISCLPARE